MTVPTFPTDTLYKFCAISGIALLAFGVYIQDSYTESYASKLSASWKEREVSRVESAHLYQENERQQRIHEKQQESLKQVRDQIQTLVADATKRLSEIAKSKSAIVEKVTPETVSGPIVDAAAIKRFQRLSSEADETEKQLIQRVLQQKEATDAIVKKVDTTIQEDQALLSKFTEWQKGARVAIVNKDDVEDFKQLLPLITMTARLLQILGGIIAIFGFRYWFKIQKVQDAIFFKESKLKGLEIDEKLKERADRDQPKPEPPASG